MGQEYRGELIPKTDDHTSLATLAISTSLCAITSLICLARAAAEKGVLACGGRKIRAREKESSARAREKDTHGRRGFTRAGGEAAAQKKIAMAS
jgi:hypothetical protein